MSEECKECRVLRSEIEALRGKLRWLHRQCDRLDDFAVQCGGVGLVADKFRREIEAAVSIETD